MIDWSRLVTAEQKQAEAKDEEIRQANAKAHAFLDDTDWYSRRKDETGKPMPDGMAEARQVARDSIVVVRDARTITGAE